MYATVHISTNDEPTESAATADWTMDANAAGTTDNHSMECTHRAAAERGSLEIP